MEIAIKAAKKPAIQARARKDERPNTEVAIWRPVALKVNAQDTIGLIKGHVLYFPSGEQWYKVNLNKAQVPIPTIEDTLTIKGITRPTLSEEEKAARKKARRQARRAAQKKEDEE